MIEPLNTKVQKQYRDSLVVSSCPTRIDTDTPIAPAVIVNPSEAPVNTAVVERGTLKITAETTVSVTGNGTFTVTFTVPTNKKWVLKGIQSRKLTGTYTLGDTIYAIGIGSNSYDAYRASAAANGDRFNWPYQFVLPQAGTVVAYFIASGYSVTGNCGAILAYQEFDELQ